jgi:hypothetical protein
VVPGAHQSAAALRNATVAATTSATMTMIIAPVQLDDRIMNPIRLDPASRPP